MLHKIIWVVLLFACSCASLGTNTKTNKSIDVSSIKTIGMVTTRSTFPDEGVNKITDSLFLNLMISQLHASTGKEVKYLGETNDFLKQSEASLKESNVDAVIQCEIYLAQMATLDKSKRFNSRVRTQMFKVPEKIFIAETDFNTTMGKSDEAIRANRPYPRLQSGASTLGRIRNHVSNGGRVSITGVNTRHRGGFSYYPVDGVTPSLSNNDVLKLRLDYIVISLTRSGVPRSAIKTSGAVLLPGRKNSAVTFDCD